jgi:hypothetical protein
MTGYHPITVVFLGLETEIGRPVNDESVELDERVFIEEELEPLTSRKLAFFVLCLESCFSATLLGFSAAARQQLQLLSHGHRSEKLTPRRRGI